MGEVVNGKRLVYDQGAVKTSRSIPLRRASPGRGWWLGAPCEGESAPFLAVLSRDLREERASSQLELLAADARRLGVVIPDRLLLREGQVIYSSRSPVDVRLRGWILPGDEPGEEATPWQVGGACLLQSTPGGLELPAHSRGLHHRSLRAERRAGGLVVQGAWSLPGPARAPQLSLGFEEPAEHVGAFLLEIVGVSALDMAS